MDSREDDGRFGTCGAVVRRLLSVFGIFTLVLALGLLLANESSTGEDKSGAIESKIEVQAAQRLAVPDALGPARIFVPDMGRCVAPDPGLSGSRMRRHAIDNHTASLF